MKRKVKKTPTNNKQFSFKFTRLQFSVRLAFAMTINKYQGQILQHSGVYLPTTVFHHCSYMLHYPWLETQIMFQCTLSK